MSEDKGLRPGSASAAADAEAAAAVRSKDFIDTFKAFASDSSAGEPGPGERVEEPPPPPADDDAAAREAATDPGERTDEPPAPKEDEPPVRDDYDPEMIGDEPPPAPKSDARTDETGKTWDTLATDEDRKRVFDEMAAQLAASRTAQPQPEKQPTAAEEPPPAETVREVAERLVQDDPRARQFNAHLETVKARYDENAKTYGDLTTERGTLQTEITERAAVIKHYEGVVKGDPENYAAAEQLRTMRSELLSLETRATSLDLKIDRVQREANDAALEFNTGSKRLMDAAQAVIDSRQAQHTQQKETAKAVAKERDTIEKAIDSAKVHHKIPATQAKYFAERVAREALLHSESADIEDWNEWLQKGPGAEIAKDAMARHHSDSATYLKRKKADAEQPGPKGPAAIARPDPKAAASTRDGAPRRASDQAHHDAGLRLRDELQGARR